MKNLAIKEITERGGMAHTQALLHCIHRDMMRELQVLEEESGQENPALRHLALRLIPEDHDENAAWRAQRGCSAD